MQSIEAKICLLGDSGVGKSSLVTRFVHNTFNADNESTIGASFMTKTFVYGNAIYKLNIWDTAGQERYRALAPMYYRQASVCIVVYDVTEMESFRSVHSWVRELQTHLKDKTVIAVTGNKCDLNDVRQVATSDGKAFADGIGALFAETSAKSAQNVEQLFVSIVQTLPKESHRSGERTTGVHQPREQEQRPGIGRRCC